MRSVVAVATPEQMAVSETLGLRRPSRSELGIERDAIVVNRIRSFVVAAYRRRSATSSADGSGEENSLTAIRARATHRGQCSIASQRARGLMLSPHRGQLRHAEPSSWTWARSNMRVTGRSVRQAVVTL